MKYAIGARAYSGGKIVAKVHLEQDGKEGGCTETRNMESGWIPSTPKRRL
ncbi:hypothetical protein [Lacrimispora sp.]|nr:hypothetical protein [Lacrimispora sp.]